MSQFNLGTVKRYRPHASVIGYLFNSDAGWTRARERGADGAGRALRDGSAEPAAPALLVDLQFESIVL